MNHTQHKSPRIRTLNICLKCISLSTWLTAVRRHAQSSWRCLLALQTVQFSHGQKLIFVVFESSCNLRGRTWQSVQSTPFYFLGHSWLNRRLLGLLRLGKSCRYNTIIRIALHYSKQLHFTGNTFTGNTNRMVCNKGVLMEDTHNWKKWRQNYQTSGCCEICTKPCTL